MAKAKRRSEQLAEATGVAVAEDPGYDEPAETKPADRETKPADRETMPARNGLVEIAMPCAVGREGEHKSDHLEMRLQGRQVEALHRLWKGCEERNLALPDGRRVVSRVDVVRMILEQFADEMGLQ